MSDAEWLRGIVKSGWNNDLFSPEVKAMFSRVADTIDALPLQITWTTRHPTVPGWYWATNGTNKPYILYFDAIRIEHINKVGLGNRRIAGPIPEPMESKR